MRLPPILPTALAAFAASTVFAGAAPRAGTPAVSAALAGDGVPVPASATRRQFFRRYYLATFTTLVGNGLPESAFCFRFTQDGTWSNFGSEGFIGNYLSSGKDVFASGTWLASPAVFMSFQGAITANEGSGTFVTSAVNGDIDGGGTFTMTRRPDSGCS